MNQAIKDNIYGLGTQRHIDFIAQLGGMNEEETKLFNLMHQGKTDMFIQEELGLSRASCSRIEESVRAKLRLAIFECIHHYMDYWDKQGE